MISRRAFLSTTALGCGAFLAAPQRLLAETPRVLRAGPASARLLPEGEPRTSLWGYDGSVPGPLLRLRQGEELAVTLENGLEQPTAVHWHGIRIDNAMDGVVGLTQDAIPPGGRFDYRFTPPDAGTYWYHSHNRSWEQMARGLYGVLVVEERNPPTVDRDEVIVADDWRLDEAGQIHEESLGAVSDAAHAGRLGNVLTLNSLDFLSLEAMRGERMRLRLCNCANARILALAFTGHAPWLIALDGQPVAPREVEGVELAPGQRADLILDAKAEPGSRHPIVASTSGQSLEVGEIVYGPQALRDPESLDPVAPLPDAGLQVPDLGDALRVDLIMEGGAMGAMTGAVLEGETLDIRSLVQRGFAWSFNGVAGRPTDPWFSVPRGRSIVARLVNDTAWPHAIHSHGHHFLTLTSEGALPPDPQWRDTVLLQRGEERTIAFVADNPGKWLLHCHMLEHQAAGMVTWFEVA
ncbi:multicopper oxidase family protein [Limibacillus halophilus]